LLFNIAMENGPFIDGFPIKTSIYKGFSMAMLNNQRVPLVGFYSSTSLGVAFLGKGLIMQCNVGTCWNLGHPNDTWENRKAPPREAYGDRPTSGHFIHIAMKNYHVFTAKSCPNDLNGSSVKFPERNNENLVCDSLNVGRCGHLKIITILIPCFYMFQSLP